jgi:ribosome-associated translation inhibitor RaiA
MSQSATNTTNATKIIPEVSVVSRGAVPAESRAYARRKILALARQTDDPVRYARVRLTQAADPVLPRPAAAQANLDVNGRSLRTQVAAATMHEAIDLLRARIRKRLATHTRHWEARLGGVPLKQARVSHGARESHGARVSHGAREWHQGSEPTHHPDYYPRPPGDREIVRRKAFVLPRETPDEAAFDMEDMDYSFRLFIDAESGQDSIISRDDHWDDHRDEADGGCRYRLAQAGAAPHRRSAVAVPLTTSTQPAPRLSVGDAVNRLNLTGLPFVFFVDDATGRGNVLYHRYDGHYGLITPVAAARASVGSPSGR